MRISQRSSLAHIAVVDPKQVAVANGLTGTETFREGQVIKIAVEEAYAGKR